MFELHVWIVAANSLAGSALGPTTPDRHIDDRPTAVADTAHAPTVFEHGPLDCHFDPAANSTPMALAMAQYDQGVGSDRSEPSYDTSRESTRQSTRQSTSVAEAPPPFGTPGSMRLNVQGGFGIAPTGTENRFGSVGIGLSYFATDDLSVDVELNGLYFNHRGDDAAGINVNLLLRYHFLKRDTWSLYVDGGAGLLLTSDDVPSNGSSFNFTPQVGLGFTWDVGSDNRLMAGVRWHHVSNANTFDTNPGRDSVYLYAGLSMPF